MNRSETDKTWFAVLDSRKGRLFEMERTAQGRLHVEERDSLAETWEEKEHHRPYMLAGKGRGYPFAKEDEERIHRFARDAARWLSEQSGQHHIEQLTVFCAKPLLGPLRRSCAPAMAEHLDLRAQDLAWLTPAELARHPAVTKALG